MESAVRGHLHVGKNVFAWIHLSKTSPRCLDKWRQKVSLVSRAMCLGMHDDLRVFIDNS
jgi:hypothetical protein